MKDFVTVREVGLRDGLQLSKTKLSTKQKLNWCREQAQTGFKEIEVTSIVPPSILPQFSDCFEVIKEAKKIENLLSSVLVPNFKGGLKALDTGVKKITFVLSASDAHNQSNVNTTIDNSLNMLEELVKENKRRNKATNTKISLAIATSFGCSIQGKVSEKVVCKIAEKSSDLGVDEINLADTVGYANPKQVSKLFSKIFKIVGDIPLAGHFHDTRGMGLSNVISAYDVGVKRFDASLGGLGGCPFAPGASGNISTEDCIYMLESIGAETGVLFDKLLELRKKIEHLMYKDRFYGRLVKSGCSKIFKNGN